MHARRPFLVSQPTHAPGSAYKPKPREKIFGVRSLPISGSARRVATPLAERNTGLTSSGAIAPVPFGMEVEQTGQGGTPQKTLRVNLTEKFESDKVQGEFMADIFANICVGKATCYVFVAQAAGRYYLQGTCNEASSQATDLPGNPLPRDGQFVVLPVKTNGAKGP